MKEIKWMLIVVSLFLSCCGYSKKNQAKQKRPTEDISLIRGAGLTVDELVYVASLQGVVAKKQALIYLDMGDYAFWLNEFERQGYNFSAVGIKQLTDRYLTFASGYVMADIDNIAVAATVAGPLNAIVLTPDMLAKSDMFNDLQMLMDVRGKNEEWLLHYVKENNDRFSYESILQHNPSRPYTLIDYAISENKLCIVGKGKPGLVTAFYELITPNTPRLGWGAPYGKEKEDVSLGAAHGLFTIPASNTLNLTFFVKANIQKRKRDKSKPNVVKPKDNVHYVMLMMSDGDNLNWCLGGLVTGQKYMANPVAVGQKINWMYPPMMSSLIPTVHEFYRNYLPNGNYLMGGVSGAGYTYPSKQKNLVDYAKLTARSLKESNLDYGVMMDLGDFRTTQLAVLKKMLGHMPDVKGLYYMDYGNYAKWEGDYYKIDNKPIVSFRHRLWLPHTPMEDIVKKINGASRDIHSADAYSAVVVHAWSYTMTEVAQFIEMLDKDVVLVNGDEFMELISNNVYTDNYE